MRFSASMLLAIVALAPEVAAQSRDRWQRVAPGVRLLTRTARNHDGTSMRVFAAVIDLCSPGRSLHVSTEREGRRTVSAFAAQTRALVAINGDYFDLNTRTPLGVARGAGQWWPDSPRVYHDAVLAMREGVVVEPMASPSAAVGAFEPLRATLSLAYTDVLAAREQVLRAGASVLSPHIAHDGHRQPRTAIGLSVDRRTMVLLVIDGRSRHSAGATVEELAMQLRSLGAYDGFKLDGGGSSTLYVRGRGVINRPSDGHERVVGNHLAVLQRAGAPMPSATFCAVSPRVR